jgi:heme-degrading monooxygenase HmoA
MFAVIFEVQPKPQQWDAYLGYARMLRPDLQQVDGFVDNTRYRSLTREGWILSLSGWRDEKALVRWRTHSKHHGVQEKGRAEILSAKIVAGHPNLPYDCANPSLNVFLFASRVKTPDCNRDWMVVYIDLAALRDRLTVP